MLKCIFNKFLFVVDFILIDLKDIRASKFLILFEVYYANNVLNKI